MPTPTRVKKSIGEQGLAEIRVLKSSVRIAFENGEQYDVDKESINEGITAGKYNVTMNKQNTKVIAVRPPAGSYTMRFKQFGNRNHDVPEPKLQPGGMRPSKDGGHWYAPDRLIVIATLEVASEKSKYFGLTATKILPYTMEQYKGTDIVEIAGSRGDVSQQEAFYSVLGFNFMADEIPFSGNTLPWLERYLQAKNELVLVSIDDSGFAASISQLPEELRV